MTETERAGGVEEREKERERESWREGEKNREKRIIIGK